MGQGVKPVLQALLVADRVYQDKASGKRVIAGTFNRLWFRKDAATPKKQLVDGEERQLILGGTQAGSPTAYISLTEIHGTVKCLLRYVNLKDNKAYFQCEFKIQCDDPLQTIELDLPLPALPPWQVSTPLSSSAMTSQLVLIVSMLKKSRRTPMTTIPRLEESPSRFGAPGEVLDLTPWEDLGEDTYELRVLICPEASNCGWSAHALRVPGVVSQGDTAEEALENIAEAFRGALAVYRGEGRKIPWAHVDIDRPKGALERWILVHA